MVNFCAFSLLLSYVSREPSGNNYFPMVTPPPHWKIRQIDPPLPPGGKSDPFRGGGGGGMDIFWNRTLLFQGHVSLVEILP